MREFCILSMPAWWMTAAATYSIHFTTSSYIKWNTMRSQADLEIPALDLSFDFLFRNRSLDFPLILRILHFVRTCVLCPENQKLVFVKSFLWRVRSRRINGLSRFTRSKWALKHIVLSTFSIVLCGRCPFLFIRQAIHLGDSRDMRRDDAAQ